MSNRKVRKAARILYNELYRYHESSKSDYEMLIEAFLILNMGGPYCVEVANALLRAVTHGTVDISAIQD